MDRWGPAIAVIAALVMLCTLVPANARGGNAQGASFEPVPSGDVVSSTGDARPPEAAPAPGSGEAVGGPGSGARVEPVTPEEALAEQTTGSSVWGPEHGPGRYPAVGPETVCREDGAMPDFWELAPRCLPLFSGDNGGETDVGVSRDEVRVLWYVAPTDPAMAAVFSSVGLTGDIENVREVGEKIRRYFNLHRETYGREIVVEEFGGSGTDAQSQRADAIDIAENKRPFVVFANGANTAFTEELSARGIPCVGCLVSQSRGSISRYPGMSFTSLPTTEQYFGNVAQYLGRSGLINTPADRAGAEPPGELGYNDVRRLGLVYLGTNLDGSPDPTLEDAVHYFEQELATFGGRLDAKIAYQLDVPQYQAQAANIIAQLRSANVNAVILYSDPTFPISLTKEATRQQYFPEWIQTGTLLTDWTLFGRTYDPAQWQHSYGLSAFPIIPADYRCCSIYNTYLHMGGDPNKQLNYTTFGNFPNLWTIFDGIHLAGPGLTRRAFAEGLFAAPLRRGIGVRVKLSVEDPAIISDFAEVWWDPAATGKDELGRDGVGMLVRADGNKRYAYGEWPSAPPRVFEDDPNPLTEVPPLMPFDHGADGHTHSEAERCRSCR